MQLIPIQEALAEIAKVMIDNMNNLRNCVVTLEKFTTLTPTNSITNEPQPPSNNNSSYIPKSAHIKLTLQYSHALANYMTIKGLEEKLELIKKDFMQKTTDVLEDCAELEAITKEHQIKTFLFHMHKITQAFILHEKNNNSKKRKNLQGDQAPRPPSPANEKGKNTPQPKKKQKEAQKATVTSNNGKDSILKYLKKKVRFHLNPKKRKGPSRRKEERAKKRKQEKETRWIVQQEYQCKNRSPRESETDMNHSQ
jgi:hypothetical protein